jgi:hypothetical protein
MRKILWICVIAAGATLVQAAAASAQTTVILRAVLTGGEETPNPVLTGAVGTVEVAVDPFNQEIAVQLQFFNMPTGTTASHIHIGPKPTSDPVVIDFPIARGVTGDYSLNFRVHEGSAFHARPEIGIITFADALQAIAAGNGYVNVHSTANPGGEIRGQLVVVQTFPNAGQ